MGIVDGKHYVFDFLKNRFDELMTKHPEKINVIITTEAPQIEKLLKNNRQLAYIIISRIQNEYEYNLISDLFQGNETYIGDFEERTGGNLQTDFFEIEIQTTNPQYRDDLYNLTRYLFLYYRKRIGGLIGNPNYPGLRNIRRTTGKDLPTETTGELPTFIYKAALTYLVQTDLLYKDVDELVEDIIVDEILINTDVQTGIS